MEIKKITQIQKQRIHRFYQISNFLVKQDYGDPVSHKFNELAQKAFHDDLAIAFCGHFSAGKSSMINELMNEEILPSSPIPTSANVVTIKSGEPSVKLTDHNGNVQTMAGELDLDSIKRASKNGADIQSIEIHKKHPYLENSTVIMDTPGIDSVDDAHRVSTESMLHLADVIVYVMDYNHVQSELNFNFTKKMYDLGKELVLVVNQIDKHVDSELPFSTYRKSIIDSFKQWGVHPVEFFFTSIRNKEYPNNELAQLKSKLDQIKGEKGTYIDRTLAQISTQLIENYLSTAYPSIEEVESQLSELETITKDWELTKAKKEELITEYKRQEEHFLLSLKTGIENARIIPYEIRELGKEVLESLEGNFRTGILFSRRKTAEERESRMNRYIDAVNKNTSTELEWHVKEELFKLVKKLELTTPDIEERIHNLCFQVKSEDVQSLIQQGATFNEAYILQFNKDVEDTIKRNYRFNALEIVESIKEDYNKKQRPARVILDNDLYRIHEQIEGFNRMNETVASFKAEKEQLNHKLQEDGTEENWERAIQWCSQLDEQHEEMIEINTLQTIQENSCNTFVHSPSKKVVESEPNVLTESDRYTDAKRLNHAAESLSSWRSMEDLISRMRQQASKMKNREFTVALFGAFSAGKSSFANAWMKDDVLPVSPNPTTATINKIMPVTEENVHGTVKIQLKSEDSLLEELQGSLKRFGYTCSTLEEAITIINNIEVERPDPHHSFLLAVKKGYEAMRNYLGSTQVLDHTNFAGFVSQEERACFTESVELYYDCELTRQGITLVDTPGADSINARHTSVAFDYIKNADAIVFVTYYNHAFSKADRDFLVQLGRVKDTFSMDKMYFVINAADLAVNGEERQAVSDYVETQLIEYGIRHPRMFAVSSKQALTERKENKSSDQSQFNTFEQSFQQNTVQGRDSLAQKQALALMNLGLERVDEWIIRAQSGEKQREQEISDLKSENDLVVQYIRTFSFKSFGQSTEQEVKELLHYVVHRLMLTFNEEFKVAFNPSVLTKDMKREQLTLCLNELLNGMSFQLDQELRATSLRMERFINTIRQRFYESVATFSSEQKNGVTLISPEETKLNTPDIDSEWSGTVVTALTPLLRTFKNPKQFFEGNGKDQMQDGLSNSFKPHLEELVAAYTKQFIEHYLKALRSEGEQLRHAFENEIQHYYNGLIEALNSSAQVDELIDTKRKLTVLLSEQKDVTSER
ncbi:dynamin family protein [Pseudalkalibacillus decolorationis]|uniref:dynamin family protein n=1 Tax=Pseudalkalibacillus decolorationis TaxID=163879 RepID=UPI0021479866|nr:dynamin family protein [Pseudalkalibacillus decolorationis]